MRNTFAKEITRLAAEDPRIVLLSGDIGNRLFDDFKSQAPDRFYNCGVAEANMIGVAAGLAMSGFRPVCYTITPFITYRCIEQIRVDLCYHRLPVVVVGTGSGLSYASLGATHHSCEEMGMLRLLPEMTVLAPADPVEVSLTLRAALSQDHPCYIRIGKKGEPTLHAAPPESFALGQFLPMREGEGTTILSCGTVLPVALEVADTLAAEGTRAAVWSCPSVKPLDVATLSEVCARSQLVVTVEEHSAHGGFGSAVGEWLLSQGPRPAPRLLTIGTPDSFLHTIGGQSHARRHFGLTAPDILARIREAAASLP